MYTLVISVADVSGCIDGCKYTLGLVCLNLLILWMGNVYPGDQCG